MRICHFSDWHWNWLDLPAADLYICTGDMLKNFPVKTMRAYGTSWSIDPAVERIKQKLAMHQFTQDKGFRSLLGNPDAPVLSVRGNHDFVGIAPLFADCNHVHEFLDNEVVVLDTGGCHLRVTGHRGVPYIAGTWSDELLRADLTDRMRRMPPDVDIYLTHYPPSGVQLDDGYGLDGMANWMMYEREGKGLHCFGHIHEAGGFTFSAGGTLFSNGAKYWNLIEGDPESGWTQVYER